MCGNKYLKCIKCFWIWFHRLFIEHVFCSAWVVLDYLTFGSKDLSLYNDIVRVCIYFGWHQFSNHNVAKICAYHVRPLHWTLPHILNRIWIRATSIQILTKIEYEMWTEFLYERAHELFEKCKSLNSDYISEKNEIIVLVCSND